MEADVEGDRRDVLDVESASRLGEGDEVTSLQKMTLVWIIFCVKRGTLRRYSLNSTKVLSAASNLHRIVINQERTRRIGASHRTNINGVDEPCTLEPARPWFRITPLQDLMTFVRREFNHKCN